ncbi:Calcineurin-like phosphoesterase [Friedmanniella luteola]|uniref:Calcineurin-like phosphoesterase n=1 Tax=Friedmanniella luteola TaxID=546871 RepID=A0A1H1YP33_9ACTN|nr:metallophosphoesterase [Friedmanniella luteola]SDT23082.1 Calcineurin-like phosphoesterase [Friedmanniella luteola]
MSTVPASPGPESTVPGGGGPPGTGRVAVVGDLGGHLEELTAELVRLGADPVSGRLPDDLTVVQVGDLVHRGPDSEGVLALVDHLLRTQPGQWVQLVGNHEAQYLAEPLFDWPERLGAAGRATLRRWWSSGLMRVAAAVTTAEESYLVTHAGLTTGFWRDVLGGTEDVRDAGRLLNALAGEHEAELFRPGHMLTGRRPARAAGPVWAAAATELVPGWADRRLPFSQVHGHSSVYDWRQLRFRVPADLVRVTRLDEEAKHATTTLDGGRLVGVDPGHGREPVRPWRALELAGRLTG